MLQQFLRRKINTDNTDDNFTDQSIATRFLSINSYLYYFVFKGKVVNNGFFSVQQLFEHGCVAHNDGYCYALVSRPR